MSAPATAMTSSSVEHESVSRPTARSTRVSWWVVSPARPASSSTVRSSRVASNDSVVTSQRSPREWRRRCRRCGRLGPRGKRPTRAASRSRPGATKWGQFRPVSPSPPDCPGWCGRAQCAERHLDSVLRVLNDDELQRALVICAHPDDVDFGAAGTVATWADVGIQVAYCIVTDGDAGGFDPSVPRAEIPGIRRAEQTAAAKAVGVHDLTFLGYPDGRLVATLELRRDLARVIRRVRPQRVLCPSPERNWQRIFASHPDHLAAGEAALAAVYPDARNPFAHPELLDEGYEPWAAPDVWMMAAPLRNRWVDVPAMFPRKLEALRK